MSSKTRYITADITSGIHLALSYDCDIAWRGYTFISKLYAIRLFEMTIKRVFPFPWSVALSLSFSSSSLSVEPVLGRKGQPSLQPISHYHHYWGCWWRVCLPITRKEPAEPRHFERFAFYHSSVTLFWLFPTGTLQLFRTVREKDFREWNGWSLQPSTDSSSSKKIHIFYDKRPRHYPGEFFTLASSSTSVLLISFRN